MQLHFLTTNPFSRINDYIPFKNKRVLDTLASHQLIDKLSIDNKANSFDTRYQFEMIQESFVYVATETVFHYPSTFLSEKSFKGITAKRPFILVAAPFSLQYLRTLGFKTFSEYWDESYDLEVDPEQRMLKIIELLNSLCQLNLSDLTKLLIEMESVLQYNFSYYQNLLFNNELAKFKKDLDCLK